MRILKLIFLMLWVTVPSAFAAQVTIDLDAESWPINERILIEGRVISILATNGLSDRPKAVNDNNGVLVFEDPSPQVATLLTSAAVRSDIQSHIVAMTVTPQQAKSNELEDKYTRLEEVLTAYTQVLKAKNPSLVVSNMKADVIQKMKQNEGL